MILASAGESSILSFGPHYVPFRISYTLGSILMSGLFS